MPQVAGQYPAELLQQLWSAQWITHPDSPQRDTTVLHFRKTVQLSQEPEHFIVHVSADNQFQLYVSELAHWRYETYDLAPFLHTGSNVLAATVWNFGVLTPLAQISDRTAFVLHGDGDAERLADTNESWLVEQEKGIEVLPTPELVRRKYYVSEPAEKIDGARFNWDWNADSISGRDIQQSFTRLPPTAPPALFTNYVGTSNTACCPIRLRKNITASMQIYWACGLT